MSRPRKPAKLLELNGSFKKNPSRRRQDIEVDEELEAPPECFTESQVAAYNDLVLHTPEGVLTRADSIHCEITARLLAESREDFSAFTAARLTALLKSLGKLGLSPVDRMQLAIPAAQEAHENPFNDF